MSYIAGEVVRRQAAAARIRYTGGRKGWVGDVPRFNYSVEKLGRLGWKPHLTSTEAVNRAVGEAVADAAAGADSTLGPQSA